MVVILIVNVIMEIVMNKLTKTKIEELFKDGKNVSGKPIFITFKADW